MDFFNKTKLLGKKNKFKGLILLMRIAIITIVCFVFWISALAQAPKLMLPIGHNGPVNFAEFSKDGRKAATASDDKTAKIWDVESGRLLANLMGHQGNVKKIHFSPDGSGLITYADDGVTGIWDAHTFRLIKMLPRDTVTFDEGFDPSFSANNKWIVTVSYKKVCLWNAFTGKLITSVVASDRASLTSARFSTDGGKIVSASRALEVNVWRIDTTKIKGKVILEKTTGLRNLRKLNESISWSRDAERRNQADAIFSSNGKWVATMHGLHKFVQVSDAVTGNLIADFDGHSDYINTVCFNPDNTLLVTTSKDGTARIWDSKTGKLKYTLDEREGPLPEDSKTEAYKISFSPNGKQLLVLSTGNGTNELSCAKIWDPETGRLQRTVDSAVYISNAAFNFNGSKLILAINNNFSNDQKAVIYDLNITAAIKYLGGHTGSLSNMELSKDASRMLTFSPENNLMRIWDTKEGKILFTIKSGTAKDADNYSNSLMHFNQDASMLLYSLNNDVQIYNTKNGALINRFSTGDEKILDINFAPDQQKMVALTFSKDTVSGVENYRIAEWELTTGKFARVLYEVHSPVMGINSSQLPEYSNNRSMLLDVAYNTVQVRNAETGNIIASFQGHKNYQIHAAHFNPDNKKIIIASGTGGAGAPDDYEVNIWDIASGKIISKLKDPHQPYIIDAFFMPDSNRVLTVYSRDSAIKMWDALTGAPLFKINNKNQSFPKVYISPNGQKIIIADYPDRLQLWDGNKGNLIKNMEGHSGEINAVMFTPNSDYIITTSQDKTLKKWDAQTGKLLYTAFVIDSADYLVVDNDGRYDGSESARKSLYFMCDDEMIDLEQFEKLCWEPGLVSKLQGFNKEPISAKKLSDINICNFTPQVEQKGLVNGNYNYVISERKGGIGEVQLFINGKQIKSYQNGALAKDGLHAYRLSVPAKELDRYFSSGVANSITVKATTKDNSMTSRGGDGEGPVLDKKKGNPNMYIVSIGINEYKGQELKLRYASTDAESFASVLKSAAQKLLNTDSVQHIKNYVFSTETANPNKPFKKAIKEQLAKIAAESAADDILVIFFAGHGVLQGVQKKFYLLTADAAAFNLNGVENDVAISFDELSEWMRNIVANKQVLIMDACNSGEAIDAQNLMGKREIPADLARAQENLKDQTGIYMLAASASGRPAFEASQFGQGLLTYSLLNGIKNQEALQGNGFIDITKWFTSAARNVSELAREVGERQDPKVIGNQSFDVGLVDAALLNSIQLPVRKPIFQKSNFLQTDLMIDNLHLSNSVDSILNVRAAMGRESSLTYVESYKSADAYSIRGNYSVENDRITIKVLLIQGEKMTGYRFEKTGAVGQAGNLATDITEEVIAFVKNKK
jgi:WD40 repeat protein